MKKLIFALFFLTNCILINAQSSYKIESKDSKVIAENFIGFQEGIDSVIVKNKKCRLKFTSHKPLFNFYHEDNDSDDIPNYFWASSIKKINKKVYMLVGISENVYSMKQHHLIFIKKNKILKYYVTVSDNKRVMDIKFKYLKKTKEVVIPITKQYTPQSYIYEINLKENKFDTIKPIKKNISDKFYEYQLKIK